MAARRCPHCHGNIDPDSAHKPRSVQQLRRFFALLRIMLDQWPEHHHFQPQNEEALRGWVLCRAGHYEVTDISVPSSNKEAMDLVTSSVQAAIKAASDKAYAFVQPDPCGSRVRVFSAKSIAFHKLSPAEFSQLNDSVERIYEIETGINPSVALKETENAA